MFQKPIFTIHHRARTASTNLDARAGRPGDVFTADEQTAGRGRLDHVWQSEPGSNLMMSVVLGVAGLAPDAVATLPLVVGLAVQSALAALLPAVPFRLKWPNDVLARTDPDPARGGADLRKVCGILCERQGDAVIAGIGVNVNQTRFAPDLADRATSLANLGARLTVATVRDAILSALGPLSVTWGNAGFAALYPRFAAIDCLKGRTLSILQTDTDTAPLTGLCDGIQPDGTLRVAGQPVFAGEAHISRAPCPFSTTS